MSIKSELNAKGFDAAICIEAPVCGFLPSLAALCRTEKVPKPTSETVSCFPKASPIESKTASTALPADALVMSDDVATAVNNVKAGQVRFRTDKNGIIHGSIGKVSFDVTKLQTNATALIDEVKKLKPASAKGIFIGSIALSSTMGPGIKIHASELV